MRINRETWAFPVFAVLAAGLAYWSYRRIESPTVVWDFSTGHSIEAVDWPTDRVNDDLPVPLCGNRRLIIHLASGRVFKADVEHVSGERRGSNIWYVSLLYPMMSLEESVALARDLAVEFGHSKEKIDSWYGNAVGKDGAPNFQLIERGNEYGIVIKIRGSYDDRRPWRVSFNLYLE